MRILGSLGHEFKPLVCSAHPILTMNQTSSPAKLIAARFVAGLKGKDFGTKTVTDGTHIWLESKEIMQKLGDYYYFTLGGSPSPRACARINAVLACLGSSHGVAIVKGKPMVVDPTGFPAGEIKDNEWYYVSPKGEIPWPPVTRKEHTSPQKNISTQIRIV